MPNLEAAEGGPNGGKFGGRGAFRGHDELGIRLRGSLVSSGFGLPHKRPLEQTNASYIGLVFNKSIQESPSAEA